MNAILALVMLLVGAPAAAQSAPEGEGELVLTGCLERETKGERSGMLVFESRAGEQQPGTHTGAATTAVRRYVVEPAGDVDLEAHAGHHVRLTGRVKVDDPQDRRSNAGITPSLPSGGTGMETIPRPNDTPGDTQGSEARTAVDPSPSTFVVTDVQMLSAACPRS